METDLTIVILAAGLGTRMKSAKAKVLHNAGGQTLIEHVVDTALQLTPPDRVFVVVGHQAEQVRQALQSRGVGIIEQTEQKGTGHALMVGREALSPLPGRLMVLYGDCPLISAGTLRRLIGQQRESAAAATLITTLLEDPTGYGRVIADAAGRVVTIEKPETVTIDSSVRIGMDTVVEPFARILGSTTIGEECLIGACSILRDSRLGRRVVVGPFTSIQEAHLEDDAQAGPYARLRMGAQVESGAHGGNFVALKKARLGAGAKGRTL